MRSACWGKGWGKGHRAPSGPSRVRVGLTASLLALGALVGAAAALSAQMYGPRMATRAELEAAVDSLEHLQATASVRELNQEIVAIRDRLEHGDIRPGDVVTLSVSGEEKWTGEFTVTPRQTLELEDIDPIPLTGVLYAEAEETVARALSRYLREPRVRLDVLKRIAVLGQVGSPGFYNVKGSALVSDVIMMAGGPGGNAKVEKLQIRRDGDRIPESEARVAFQSRSLDQLGVVSGDELFVPGGTGVSAWRIFVGALGVAGSITLLITRL